MYKNTVGTDARQIHVKNPHLRITLQNSFQHKRTRTSIYRSISYLYSRLLPSSSLTVHFYWVGVNTNYDKLAARVTRLHGLLTHW